MFTRRNLYGHSSFKKSKNRKKWLQKDVAEKIGVGRTTYAMYEQGKREPDNATLQKLAELFEVSADYLLGRNNTEKNTIS